MYEVELNYYTKKIIESCVNFEEGCNCLCPLLKACTQYRAEKEKEKEKPVWHDFTERQIELAAQALFEEMLNCGWDNEIIGRHTDFWTNEQKDAYNQMAYHEQIDIDDMYSKKVLKYLKNKCDDWWNDIVIDHWNKEHDAINDLYGWGNNLYEQVAKCKEE
jgi:hypothetical protein